MTGIETILMIAGSVMSAVGQLKAGANAQKAANFNAQASHQNARAARLAAAEDAKRERRLSMKRKGARRAIDPDKMGLLEDNAMEEALALASIIHAGEVQATGFDRDAQLAIARGKTAQSTAKFGAAGSVLMGGATALDGSSLFTSSSAPPIIPPRRH